MTREEAIKHFKEQLDIFGGEHAEAIKVAIEALKNKSRPFGDCSKCIHTYGTLGCCTTVSNEWVYDCEHGMEQYKNTSVPSADRPRGEWIDCIDRQELIGSIQYLFDGLADSWVEASEKIIEIIREEPTVPQKRYTEQQIRDTFNSGFSCGIEREWIDAEEEMPIDSQEVIASVYWTDYGDSITAYGHYNARFDEWKLYSDTEGELNKGFEVIAWMPLPEPYKGGEDE